jgi:glc operon protein GlcG
MKNKPVLEQCDVQKILDVAVLHAQQNHWAVSIAVCDDGGHLLGFMRMDGAAPVSATISTEKARTCALGRRESKVYEDMINNGRVSFLSVVPLQGMLEGGVPIVIDGQHVGAVGVSGVKSSEDAEIAKAGILAVL